MEHSCDPEQAHDMAEELRTLYTSGSKLYEKAPADSLERQDHNALKIGSTYGSHNLYTEPSKIQFGESAYNVFEQEVYASQIGSKFQ